MWAVAIVGQRKVQALCNAVWRGEGFTLQYLFTRCCADLRVYRNLRPRKLRSKTSKTKTSKTKTSKAKTSKAKTSKTKTPE